jgi:exosortase H (IPTLxxWG-CTERM-specific)
MAGIARRRVITFLRRHRVALKSGAIFVAGILLSALVYSQLVTTGLFAADAAFTARATGFFLNLLGQSVQVTGHTVTSASFSVDVGTGCTATIPILLFICAVLAYPGRWKLKALGIVSGAACLYALNLVRTVSLFFIGTHFHGFFETAHLLLWQPLIILAAVILWLFWVRRTNRVPVS